jgi:proteasome assembly chaperone 2
MHARICGGMACTRPQPAVAFANVGELAVDVLVTTLGAQLAARLDSPNLLACVGNNAYQPQPPGLLATAAELYHVPGALALGV